MLLCNRRIFPRRIPKRTSVNPEDFPDADFPIICLECGYSLKTLADGNCPECGQPFVRGELLVEIYARSRLPRRSGLRSFSKAFFLIGLVLFFFWFLIVIGLDILLRSYSDLFFFVISHKYFLACLTAIGLGGFSLFFAGMLLPTIALPSASKRKLVRDAALRVTLQKPD